MQAEPQWSVDETGEDPFDAALNLEETRHWLHEVMDEAVASDYHKSRETPGGGVHISARLRA